MQFVRGKSYLGHEQNAGPSTASLAVSSRETPLRMTLHHQNIAASDALQNKVNPCVFYIDTAWSDRH
jgi:hypothetical protein